MPASLKMQARGLFIVDDIEVIVGIFEQHDRFNWRFVPRRMNGDWLARKPGFTGLFVSHSYVPLKV